MIEWVTSFLKAYVIKWPNLAEPGEVLLSWTNGCIGQVGSIGLLSQTRRTTRRLTEVAHLSFNSMRNKYLGFVTFREKLEVAERTQRLAESPS
ncbi:hypothetical protein MTR67_048287 [Solanum verrucosum]|uniref:Uncharacterized protein n=1 Tax=Solanum verrucosum TaxID=315347 RepID=A0AAF0UYL3_SOLVR|nr:hypothetical protein MTR67_048282 [Solanum verrucosum]WMV54902.1 hypothetical protein MTR67_048287 [Solanum verrucosum]